MNVLKLISRTNACMLVIMPLHHAMSPCHIIIMPCHHATSACHIIMPFSMRVIMPCHHATSSCHVSMPCHHAKSSCNINMLCHHATSPCHVIRMHFLTTMWQLEGVPRGTSAKIFPVGAKLQNAISFASKVRLTRRLHRWNWLDEIFDMVLFLLKYYDFENWPF